MKPITIVRLEKDGLGIFRPEDYRICADPLWQSLSERHQEFPTPYQEDLEMEEGDREWFCAYNNVEQFKEWVKQDELEFFIQEGFKVLMLEVTDYQTGIYQVIFTKESIISETDITEAFIKN